MARSAPCSCSSRLLATPVRQAPTSHISAALRGPTAARSGRPPLAAASAAAAAAAAAAGANAEAAGKSNLRTLSRATAREQRIQEEAVAVRQAVQRGQHGKETGSPSTGQVEAVAAQFLRAGMSKAGLIELLGCEPRIAGVELWRLSGKLASVELIMKGVKRNKTTACNRLCRAAAAAALDGRVDAAFHASCCALAQLLAAADSEACIGATLVDVQDSVVVDLCKRRGGDVLALFNALQRHLAWSPHQAAAALLSLDVQPGPFGVPDGAPALLCHISRSRLRGTPAAHVEELGTMLRECGLEGEELAFVTQAARANWPAVSVARAREAVQGLQDALVPPREAAVVWLSCGIEVTTPRFLTIVHQLRQAGVEPERLQLFVRLSRRLHRVRIPERFAGGMFALCALCGGSWAAAMEAAEAHPFPMLNLHSRHSADFLAVCQRLSQLGLPLEQLLKLAEGARERPATLAAALDGLSALLGGDQQAMGQAVLVKPALVQVKQEQEVAVHKMWQQLGQLGLRRGALLRLAENAATQPEVLERDLQRLVQHGHSGQHGRQ